MHGALRADARIARHLVVAAGIRLGLRRPPYGWAPLDPLEREEVVLWGLLAAGIAVGVVIGAVAA